MSISQPTSAEVRAGANLWREAGFCVLPGQRHSKQPKNYKGHGARGKDGVRGFGYSLFRDDPLTPLPPMTDYGAEKHPLLCALGGPHGLVMLEREGKGKTSCADEAAIAEAIADLPDEDAAERLLATWHTLQQGCVDTTPTGGVHWYLRLLENVPQGWSKVASASNSEVLWEVKGFRTVTVVAPSPATATHRNQGYSAPYARRCGSPVNIPQIELADFLAILQVIRDLFDRREFIAGDMRRGPTGLRRPLPEQEKVGGMPSWHEILVQWNGFSVTPTPDRFLRPGSDVTSNSSVTATEGEKLKCWSSSVEGLSTSGSYTKAQAIAAFHFDGDELAAARWLSEKFNGFVIESAPKLPGEEVSLEEYRQRHAAAQPTTPGLYVTRAQTGTGKTFTAIQAIPQNEAALIGLPTHDNVAETVALLTKMGLDAAATPPLDEVHCNQYVEADLMQKRGFSVGDTLCPTCEFRKQCLYRPMMREAKKARILVTTQARAAIDGSVHEVEISKTKIIKAAIAADLEDMAARNSEEHRTKSWSEWENHIEQKHTHRPRTRVIIDETPTKALTPTKLVDVDELMNAWDLFRELRHVSSDQVPGASVWSENFSNTALDWLARLRDEADNAWTECRTVPTVQVELLPRLSAALAHAWNSLEPSLRPLPDAVAFICTALVRNKVSELGDVVLFADTDKHGDTTIHAQVTMRTRFPANATVVCLDATANPDALEAVDITPHCHVTPAKPITQIPFDVTSNMSPQTVIDEVLVPFLKMNPGIRKLGVIGHRKHIEAMRKLEETRIVMTTYFNQGLDASSNAWNRRCDHILVIGTPRPPSKAIRSELIRRNMLKEAASQPPHGIRHWQAGSGPIAYHAYLDDVWNGVHIDIGRARLLQACGRGRSLDSNSGVPVTVVSTQPLPFALGNLPSPECADTYWVMTVCRKEVTCEKLAKLCGISVNATQKRLASLKAAGWIYNTHRGLWSIRPLPSKADLALRRTGFGHISLLAAKAGVTERKFRETCTVGIRERAMWYHHQPEIGVYWGFDWPGES